jgi:hypothetical protein
MNSEYYCKAIQKFNCCFVLYSHNSTKSNLEAKDTDDAHHKPPCPCAGVRSSRHPLSIGTDLYGVRHRTSDTADCIVAYDSRRYEDLSNEPGALSSQLLCYKKMHLSSEGMQK